MVHIRHRLIFDICYPIQNLLRSDPKKRISGGLDPDPDLDFTDSADPDNEISGSGSELTIYLKYLKFNYIYICILYIIFI